MPILSTFGGMSGRGFGLGTGSNLTMRSVDGLFDSLSFGSFSIGSSADIQAGDKLIVVQASADSDVTNYPDPIADGHYAPSGTGFTRRSSVSTNYFTSTSTPKRFATAGVSIKNADGTEPGTTISGFLPSYQDGYEYSNGFLLGFRPTFTPSTIFPKITVNSYNNGSSGVFTSFFSLGTVPLTRCAVLVTVLLDHESNNTSNITYNKDISGYLAVDTTIGFATSSFLVSGFRRFQIHVFPSGTNVGDIEISHTSTYTSYGLVHATAFEVGTS